MDWLVRYPWPGEIRELGNVVERAVIVSRASASEVSLRDWNSRIPTVNDEDQGRALKDTERNHILANLKLTAWGLSGPRGAATRSG
jgi:formate hydrogenlyase transcriptional activator